jgi:acetylornithine deacetylase/succinyl-diaminopimelate desuccinylase-like protein
VSKYYPAWVLEDNHPLVQAGQLAGQQVWGAAPALGSWDFSTNGTYWAGKAGIPSVGMGPGDEKTAHMMNENVPLDEVVKCAEWYAALPQAIRECNS